MPVKNKKSSKKNTSKKKTHKKEKQSKPLKEKVVDQKKSLEDIEKDIKKNVEIIEEGQSEKKEETIEITEDSEKEDHVFVKKDLPQEDEVKKEEQKEKNETSSEIASEEEISKKLTEIYEDDDGDMPDMQKFKKSNRSPFLRAFFILIFSFIFFAGVAWVGFFVIQPGEKFSEDDIVLTMSGNPDFVSGEENTYRIRYKNSQSTPLHNVILEVRYPKGFEFSTSTLETKDDNHDSWDLGDLEAGGSGYLDVTGRMFGNINDEQSFRIFLNYVPDNFSSSFQKVTNLTVKNTETLVNVEIEMPEQIVAGLDTPIKIIVSPNTDKKIENITVNCESDSFSFKSSDPKTEEGKDCEWKFDSLDSAREINVSGFFSKTDEEENKFAVNISTENIEGENKNSYILTSVEKTVSLTKLDTVFSLLVNGSAGSFDMQPGDTINTTVTIQNNGESVLKDARLKLILDAPAYNNRSILDWTNLDMIDLDGDIVGQKVSDEIRRGTISWDKRYVEGLSEIKPGDEIKLNLTIPVKDSEDLNLADYLANKIKISSELSYTINDKEESIGSNDLEIKLISDLKLNNSDEIDEDVEGNTVHKVSWLLTNTYHDLKGIEISADLYGDISLDTDNMVVPAGTIEYDKDNKKIVWKIDSMPTSVDILAAQFDITILSDNPTQQNLTSKPVIKAFDENIGEDIKLYGKEILLNNN